MQDSELLFNTISAIAIGLVLSIAPGAARAACDDLRSNHPHGLYIGAGVGQSDVDASCGWLREPVPRSSSRGELRCL